MQSTFCCSQRFASRWVSVTSAAVLRYIVCGPPQSRKKESPGKAKPNLRIVYWRRVGNTPVDVQKKPIKMWVEIKPLVDPSARNNKRSMK